MVTVKAPAKINLTLEVLRRRPDGYHEIRSVLQAIDLCDTLHLEPGDGITFRCDLPGWSAGKSLLSRTVRLLREITGHPEGVKIDIEKRIPLLSGLGGDSSAAAALLSALNEFWKLGLSPEKLSGLAVQLGSDVAFFLRGGTVLAEGRGEVINPLPAPGRMWILLVVPDIRVEPGKTGRMYAYLKTEHFTDGALTERLVRALHNHEQLNYSLLFNTFENCAFDCYSGLRVYKEHLVKMGAPCVHLAGSGPALFTVFQDKVKAADLYTRCENQGMKTCLVPTL